MNAATSFDTDVLIVGAGPTGLALSVALSRAGIRPMVVDKLDAKQNTSRAAVIHAHTLEALEPLGVSQSLLQAGLRLTHFSLRDRDQTLARLKFDWLPSRFACLLMLPQDQTEAILADALHQARGTVRWGWTVQSLTETDGGVEVMISSTSETQKVRARYVVGADGMHSLVRQAAGIGFAGHSYEESFVLADVDMHWEGGRDEVMLFFSPAGLVVVAPLPAGRFRIVATLEDAPVHPGVETIQHLLQSRGPSSGTTRVSRVHWSSRFRLHHRVADHYRRGRLLLVGDAAHVHSPAGGQGMNTGIVDACVLGKVLTEVISGRQPDTYLDHYERLRRPAAQQVMTMVGRLTSLATLKGGPRRFLRNFLFRIIGAVPSLRRKLELNLSGVSRRAATRLPGANRPPSKPVKSAFLAQ